MKRIGNILTGFLTGIFMGISLISLVIFWILLNICAVIECYYMNHNLLFVIIPFIVLVNSTFIYEIINMFKN